MVAVLRFLHIIAGIIWAGGGLMMNLVIGPAIGATGDVGRQFAGHLIRKTPFSKVMTVAGVLTVLAGATLYGLDSNWFSSGWMMTGTGIGFGIGAVAGIAALVFGAMIGSTNAALAALGAQIQGKPTDEQMALMGTLRKRQVFVTTVNTICMIIAIIFMASARFFG
jgi:uncharacterized membrane protein